MEAAPDTWFCRTLVAPLLIAAMLLSPLASAGQEATLTEELRVDGHQELLVPVNPRQLVAWDELSVLVGQPLDRQIRLYGPEGRELARVGREGEGPGEFLTLGLLGRGADTLWVYDGRQRRITLFGPDLELEGTFRVPMSARPTPELAGEVPEFGRVAIYGLAPEGTILGGVYSAVGPAAGAWQRAWDATGGEARNLLARLTRDGTILNMIETPAHRIAALDNVDIDHRFTYEIGGALRYAYFPFRHGQTSRAIAPDGSRIASVTARTDGSGLGELGVTMVDSRADTLYTVHHPFDPIPLSRSAVDSAIAAESNQIEDGAKDRGWGGATIRGVIDDFERAAQGREYPEIHPPLNRSSLIGRDGSLWIEIRTASANHRTYMVLGPEGGLVGSANVPVSVEIGDADLVTVWAIEQGEFDVPSIVRYRVSWH